MELTELRPAWSQSGDELLATLDALDDEAARRKTYRLQLLSRLDEIGYAKELGARDTIELLSLRHRLNPRDVRRDLKLAKQLPKYSAVTAALPNPLTPADPNSLTLYAEPSALDAGSSTAASPHNAEPSAAANPGTLHAGTTSPNSDSSAADADASARGAKLSAAAEPSALHADIDGSSPDADSSAPDAYSSALDASAHAAESASAPGDQRLDVPPVRLHVDQARAIITALAKVPPTVPVEDLQVAEEQMVLAARYLSPDDLAILGRKVVATLDTDGLEPAEEQARHRENLWLRPIDHGIEFGGFLAAENAELLKTAIHTLSKPHRTTDGELDPRSREKRQADALVTILEAATATTSPGPGPGVPHLSVTIDFADLRDATSQAIGELVHGANLSASAVRRLACDAAILPIVLGSKSQPLDVGTEQRFVTRAMRRALNKRDQGCVICKAPPAQCHAHHIIHWANGGPTSINNLALFCGWHHSAIHAGHWTATITNGTVHITRPAWVDPPSRQTRTAAPTPVGPSPGTASADAAACTPTQVEPRPSEPAPGERSGGEHRRREHAPSEHGPSEPAPGERSGSEHGPSEHGPSEFAGSAEREGAALAADVRAATMRAIWGEDPAPEPQKRLARLSESPPDFDPWGEADMGRASPQPRDVLVVPMSGRQ